MIAASAATFAANYVSGPLAEAMLASTLLMVFVLAVRRPVARGLGAHAAYALWALPALRLVLPPLPGWQPPVARLMSLVPTHATPLATASGDAGPMAPGPASMVPAGSVAADPWLSALAGLWLIGAVLWLGWQLWRHQQFLAAALADARHVARDGRIDILVSGAVSGPLAMGIRHPRILLPMDFRSRYAPAECRLALRHEGAHHHRGDIIANVIGLLVLAAHWWNPIAHFAWRAFRADQELACDATVIAGGTGEDRQAYGSAMLKSAAAGIPTAACAMNTKTQLKERIVMMKRHDLSPARRRVGAAIGVLAITAGLGISAAAAPPVAPTPPAPPAPPTGSSAPTPPTPPAAPAGPQRHIRTVIIKDGKMTTTTDGQQTIVLIPRDGVNAGTAPSQAPTADLPELALLEALAVSVADSATTGARPRMIITCKRRIAPGEDKAGIALDANDDCRQIAMAASPSPRETLLSARKSIEATPGLSDDQRRAALNGIDKAIAESGKTTAETVRTPAR